MSAPVSGQMSGQRLSRVPRYDTIRSGGCGRINLSLLCLRKLKYLAGRGIEPKIACSRSTFVKIVRLLIGTAHVKTSSHLEHIKPTEPAVV